MSGKRFRKKPVVIEAVQWLGTNRGAVAEFLLPADETTLILDETVLINTLEGQMAANLGDWIIKGVKGEFYPCKPDIFKATYEAVDE